MDRKALADRLVTYSDTVVAFSLVNGLGFLIALGEPDIRCSMVRISPVVFAINVVFPLAASVAIVWLRRFERRLREDQPEDELVTRFWRIASRVRLGLVWLFASFVLVGLTAAMSDPSCIGSGG